MRYRTPPSDAMVICTTGFEKRVRKQIASDVRALGGTYTNRLTPAVSILIAAAVSSRDSSGGSGKKVEFATLWKVPIVARGWIVEAMARGTLVPPETPDRAALDAAQIERDALARVDADVEGRAALPMMQTPRRELGAPGATLKADRRRASPPLPFAARLARAEASDEFSPVHAPQRQRRRRPHGLSDDGSQDIEPGLPLPLTPRAGSRAAADAFASKPRMQRLLACVGDLSTTERSRQCWDDLYFYLARAIRFSCVKSRNKRRSVLIAVNLIMGLITALVGWTSLESGDIKPGRSWWELVLTILLLVLFVGPFSCVAIPLWVLIVFSYFLVTGGSLAVPWSSSGRTLIDGGDVDVGGGEGGHLSATQTPHSVRFLVMLLLVLCCCLLGGLVCAASQSDRCYGDDDITGGYREGERRPNERCGCFFCFCVGGVTAASRKEREARRAQTPAQARAHWVDRNCRQGTCWHELQTTYHAYRMVKR